jgi:uncharacterized SAM-binding protein YcdF (DUF218 family)
MREGRRIAGTAAVLVLACFLGLLVSTQAGAALLLWGLEHSSVPVLPGELRGRVDAIVVLGGRTARIHEAARLSLATGIPLLLTGKGTGDSGFAAESEKMEDILLRQYGIGPRWVETESITTRQNAEFTWCLAKSMGVRKVALMTDPFHMPRARADFEAAGFDVVAAPAQDPIELPWRPKFDGQLRDFVPGRAGWIAARRPLLEWGGTVAGSLRRLAPSPACGRGRG